MRFLRVRFTVRRLMGFVVAVALLLAAHRVVVSSLPHVRRCWELAAVEDGLAALYRRAASKYPACAKAVPCSPAEYCYNACLTHADARGAGYPGGSDQYRARAADDHRRAAEDHERAAELRAARARLYRRAAFRWSQPLPTWTAAEEAAADVFARYPCDNF
jgi:hypothetical protein